MQKRTKNTVNTDSDKGRPRYVVLKAIAALPTRIMLLVLWVYQTVLSPLKYFFFGPQCGCRFQPTCSHYAHDAFISFGFFKGLWLTVRRILRCHPWHPGGLDPLPDVKDS